jgi:hypothetical protein
MKNTVSKKNTSPKTKGTVISEKARAKTNHQSDAQRQRLLGRALELIYKGVQGKARAHCR